MDLVFFLGNLPIKLSAGLISRTKPVALLVKKPIDCTKSFCQVLKEDFVPVPCLLSIKYNPFYHTILMNPQLAITFR